MNSYDITASALTAQRFRLDVISSNLANVNTTRRADGTRAPYLRKNVVFQELLNNAGGFGGKPIKQFPTGLLKPSSSASQSGYSISKDEQGIPTIKTGISNDVKGHSGVEVAQLIEDTTTPTKRVYDPNHPDADKEGYVEMPNINPVTELVDMISATRAYEANVTAFQATKQLNKAALEI